MKKHLYLLLSVALLCYSINGYAQISQGGTPISFEMGLPNNNFPTTTMEPFDKQALLDEDAKNAENKTIRFRFGKPFPVNLGLDNAGAWTSLPNGDRLWRQGVYSPGALTINLIFSEYYLPDGATLFIYKRDHSNVIGAFTSVNNKPHGKLGTTVVNGDFMIIEYYEPADVRGQGKVRIGEVIHAYKDVFAVKSTDSYGQAGSCNTNINCALGAAWQKEKRGVAVIIEGYEICTGSLINNAAQDGTPFFLTANHCWSTAASTWVFGFNWESKTCTNANPGPSNQYSVSGATLRARLHHSDFCLMELSETPPVGYNTYMNGWSYEPYAPTSPTSAACIHHPNGDIKKISVTTRLSQTVMDTAQCWGVYWGKNPATGKYTTTEPGSSGSPLFDQNHRIIGQLFGGGASCTSPTQQDNFGRFNVSWAYGPDTNSRINYWLDRQNLNATTKTQDGIDTRCTAKQYVLPFSQGFETVSTGLPKNWSKTDTISTASTWILRLIGAAGSRKSVQAKNFGGTTGAINRLYLPNLNIANYQSVKIKFSYAYAQNGSKSDTLQILAKSNCNNPYSSIWLKAGSALATVPSSVTTSFTPSGPTQWKTDSVTLDSSYHNSKYLSLVFENRSNGGNNIYLDNIQILVAPLPTGVETQQIAGFNVYPNPNNGLVNIDLNSPAEKTVQIALFDVLGKQVLSHEIEKHGQALHYQINMSGLPAGMYLLKVLHNGKQMVQQISRTE